MMMYQLDPPTSDDEAVEIVEEVIGDGTPDTDDLPDWLTEGEEPDLSWLDDIDD